MNFCFCARNAHEIRRRRLQITTCEAHAVGDVGETGRAGWSLNARITNAARMEFRERRASTRQQKCDVTRELNAVYCAKGLVAVKASCLRA